MNENHSFKVTVIREGRDIMLGGESCTVFADCEEKSEFLIQLDQNPQQLHRYHACKNHIYNVLMEGNRKSK